MPDFIKSLRIAFRTLRRGWGVTLIAVSSLALAIAGNVIIFSLTNGLLFRPLPYEEAHRISLIGERTDEAVPGGISPASSSNFLDWRERQKSYTHLGAFRGQPLGLGEGENLQQVSGAAVSPEFFRALGVDAAAGRVFTEDEAVRGREHVAVLTHDYWQEDLGGGDVLGDTLVLNGDAHTIVGVMPEPFEFLDPTIELMVPLVLEREHLRRHQRDVLVVGRLAPGVSDEAAQAEMTAVAAQLAEEYPEANRGYSAHVVNLRREIPDKDNRLFFALMQGAMLFVLLIACANIANLLLARGQRREREMAVRASLGASRGRLFGQLLLEGSVMASLAGAVGLGLGAAGNIVVSQGLAAQLPKFYAPVIDMRVIAATLGVTFFGGFLFSLAPVIQTFSGDLLGSLKDGTKSSASGRKRWASNALVVAELALALVFLAGAGVMLRSFQLLQNSDPGFVTSDLLTVQVTLPTSSYPTAESQDLATRQLSERLGALPGVNAVLASNSLPRHIFVPRDLFQVDAFPTGPDESPRRSDWLSVDVNYFRSLDIALESGRLFTDADRLDAEPVAVINQALASKYFADLDPLGYRITMQGESRRIIGVVENVRHGLALNDRETEVIYAPLQQLPSPSLAFAVRVDGMEATSLTEPLRRAVQGFDAHLGVTQVQLLDDFIDQFWAGQRVFTVILQAFGALALLLAALGTYGVLAYAVTQRRQEIGIRMAIGASRASVVGMILRQGLTLAVLGFALGIPGIWMVNRAIQSILQSFAPVEIGPVLGGGTVLFVVTLVASLLPALRASGIDPSTALRDD
ncbi:MAG: ABC transporter permease [Acidobacteriota bacterium]